MAQQSTRLEDFLKDFLKDPERARAYLNEAFQDDGDGDYELLICRAMRQVIRAQGFAQVSTKASIGRESLYKSFSDQGNPRMGTLLKVLHSLGFGMSLTLLPPERTKKAPSGQATPGSAAKPRAARRAPAKAKKRAAGG